MDGTLNSIVLRSIGLRSMPVILNSLSGKFILIPIPQIIFLVSRDSMSIPPSFFSLTIKSLGHFKRISFTPILNNRSANAEPIASVKDPAFFLFVQLPGDSEEYGQQI